MIMDVRVFVSRQLFALLDEYEIAVLSCKTAITGERAPSSGA